MQYDILGGDITWFNGRDVNKATSVRAKVTATCCCSGAHVDYGTAHSVSIVTGEWVPATCTLIDYYYINTQHYTVSQRKKQDTILLSVTSPNINRLFSLLDSVEKFVINSYLKF